MAIKSFGLVSRIKPDGRGIRLVRRLLLLPWNTKIIKARYLIVGIRRDFAEYERRILAEEIPCPFRIRVVDNDGNLIRDKPIQPPDDLSYWKTK